jgi:hypothetical protein
LARPQSNARELPGSSARWFQSSGHTRPRGGSVRFVWAADQRRDRPLPAPPAPGKFTSSLGLLAALRADCPSDHTTPNAGPSALDDNPGGQHDRPPPGGQGAHPTPRSACWPAASAQTRDPATRAANAVLLSGKLSHLAGPILAARDCSLGLGRRGAAANQHRRLGETKRHPVCTALKLEVVSLAESEPFGEPAAAWRPSGLGV